MKIIGCMLILAVAMCVGCAHNKNRSAFQPSTLKTEHRAVPGV